MKKEDFLSPQTVADIVYGEYGLQVSVKQLSGYDELNFLLHTATGQKFIAKASGIATPSFWNAQKHALDLLAQSPVAEKYPRWIVNRQGEEITVINNGGKPVYLRLLSFLEGNFWADEEQKSAGLYENLGKFLGESDRVLAGFFHEGAVRESLWDLQLTERAHQKLEFITDPHQRRVAGYFLLQFETEVKPHLANLRKAIIHGDVNDYNLLVDGEEVAGLIDFGDMVYSPLIHNVAIACTYAMLNHPHPLEASGEILKGYHQKYSLELNEIDLVYFLIAGRLCISVTESAHKSSLESNNQHHFLTEKAAWNLLFFLLKTNPLQACDLFRRACGFRGVISPKNHVDLLADRKKLIGRNLSISYKEPLKIVKGALQYLYDDQGRTYLDCVNNVSHVGHCNPVVVRALQKQAAILNTNTRYLNDAIVHYAKALTAKLPERLQVCYFVNSGSEANDLAIRIARHYTGRQDVIVLESAYHGTSTLAIEMSPYKFEGPGGSGKKPYVHQAVSPNLYRGKWGYDRADAGQKYAESVDEILERHDVCAFICETLLGVGGQIPLPQGYLKEVYEKVREHGGICIADEVQVGFGRVGEAFWGFELQDVVPDMVVMGKPMGNGHPLAAVVVTEEIANAFNNGMEYFNTYGGNPVSMVVGASVLQVIEEDHLQQNALKVGAYLLEGLRGLMEKFAIIGDVRGHGLFIGVELVRDRVSKEPAVPEIDDIVEAMKERGFLLSTDGPLHNVLKIKPPIIFSKDDARELVQSLEEVLTRHAPTSVFP